MEEYCFQNIQYLMKKPNGFNPKKKYPILLFLHGAGTRGNDISKLYDNPFFEIIEAHQNLPFVIIAPLCSENTWFDVFERLQLLVEEIEALPFADCNRIWERVWAATLPGNLL